MGDSDVQRLSFQWSLAKSPRIVTKIRASARLKYLSEMPRRSAHSLLTRSPILMPNSVYRYVHPQILADDQRQDLLQLRPPKGPRQKVICSLGDLRPRPQADWLSLAHKLSSALSGQADLLAAQPPDPELQALVAKVQSAQSPAVAPLSNSDLLAVHVDQVRAEESREAGPVHAGYQFWLRLV
jgi:hypothetical protein